MVGLWHTTREPMIRFVKRMPSLEGKEGALSVSFGHGFPWGDLAEAGARIWVIMDNDEVNAQRIAAQLGQELWEMRDVKRHVRWHCRSTRRWIARWRSLGVPLYLPTSLTIQAIGRYAAVRSLCGGSSSAV
ncbi:hypothetical protein AWB69_05798 [Caballeronia udeis]|uniref:Microcystin LR degradation protein MlrC N-terminal domain-containing protein n=1 Tax=Caballeronia udeis TaxID=1232866 RepID=A0A158ID74_9BURK|nr:hypothetical protein AWB69_05798 [Caballeronia udeis]